MSALNEVVGRTRGSSLGPRYVPPNVLMIFDDDVPELWMQRDHMVGRQYLQERLLDRGLYFPNFEVVFCVCAPSRGTAFSGVPWWQNGMAQEGTIEDFDWGNTHWKWARADNNYQTCHWGKLANGFGTNAYPIPGDLHVNPSGTKGITATDVANCPDWVPILDTFDEFYGITVNYEGKRNYQMWRETFNADGTTTGDGTQFIAAYSAPSTNPGDYEVDKCITDITGFMDRCASRDRDDPRYNRPMFITVAPNLGHTPTQPAPIRTPDTLDRETRQAYFDDFVDPIYDDRTGTGHLGISATAASISAAGVDATPGALWEITVSGAAWETNRFREYAAWFGSTFTTVLGNSGDTLYVGEFLVGPANSTNSFSLASTPSPGAFTCIAARPDIDQTNVQYVQGSGGVYSAHPGQNVSGTIGQRQVGADLLGTDDVLESWAQKCEELGADNPIYDLSNWIVLVWSDNGYMRLQKGQPDEKNYPWRHDFRVPCAIAGPNITVGETDFHMCNLDIVPTLCGFMGIEPQLRDGQPVAGLDLSPYMTGQRDWSEIEDRAWIINIHPRGSTKGIRTREWRYFTQQSAGPGEPNNLLTNILRDPWELRNLYNDPEVYTPGDPNCIQAQLIALTNAYYAVDPPPAPLADLTFP